MKNRNKKPPKTHHQNHTHDPLTTTTQHHLPPSNPNNNPNPQTSRFPHTTSQTTPPHLPHNRILTDLCTPRPSQKLQIRTSTTVKNGDLLILLPALASRGLGLLVRQGQGARARFLCRAGGEESRDRQRHVTIRSVQRVGWRWGFVERGCCLEGERGVEVGGRGGQAVTCCCWRGCGERVARVGGDEVHVVG